MKKSQSMAGLLFVITTFVACAGVASAQNVPPPDQVIVAVTATGIQVTFVACKVSTEQNCGYPFSIYRNPPGFNQSPWGYAALGNNGYSYQGVFNDQNQLTKGQTYTYRVCTGLSADSSASNCTTATPVTIPKPPPPPPPPPQATVTLQANPTVVQPGQSTKLTWTSKNVTSLILQPNTITGLPLAGSTADNPAQTTTYTMYASGPYGTAKASVTVAVARPCTPFTPPQGLSAFAYTTALKWTNPNQQNPTPGGACPTPPTDIVIYRMGGTIASYEQIADLSANNGILPSHYADTGPLLPHDDYSYRVCEGPADGQAHNCSGVGAQTWGTDPVLTATRVNASTVQLQIAVDQFSVSSISVTRVGSDDPCYQGARGVNVGNGLQGCRTVTTLPNGVGNPVAAHPVTVYNWTYTAGSTPNWTFTTQSAPYLIDLPADTTVKPGVEYYYQAHVAWQAHALSGSVSWPVQDSDTITVPAGYGSVVSQQTLVGGTQPLKLSGGAPPPQSGSRASAAPMANAMSRTAAPASASPTMLPTGSTAPPPQQSVTAARPMMAPGMTSPTPMLQPGSPMMSSAGPAAAPPPAQAATSARLTVPPMSAPTSGTPPSMRSAVESPAKANLNAAIKEAQQKPHDAQALYVLGKAYCASQLKNTGVSYMYMALVLAEQARNAPLASQIKTSLAEQGVRAEELNRGFPGSGHQGHARAKAHDDSLATQRLGAATTECGRARRPPSSRSVVDLGRRRNARR